MSLPGESAPTSINLRIPSLYAASSPDPLDADASFRPPPADWLHRTWSVTHSTLSMWRNKRNVRIGYTPREPTTAAGRPVARNCDLVEWEPVSGKGGVKSVSGTNTASGAPLKPSTAPAEASSAPLNTGSWDWRGKGLLFWVTSHWEILGWGERPLPGGGIERWAVTWFTPSMFTQEGIDIYADRKGGLSKETAGEIIQHLKTLPTEKLASMCESDLKEVEIKLPWKERTKLGH